MAKSKLSIKLSKALLDCSAELVHLKNILEADKIPSQADFDKFWKKFDVLRGADIDMSNHLARLKARENNTGVLAKLKKLKNTFKNKEELERQRALTAAWYKKAEERFNEIYKAGGEITKYKNANEVKQAVQNCIDTVKNLESELPALEKKVDALEEALM